MTTTTTKKRQFPLLIYIVCVSLFSIESLDLSDELIHNVLQYANDSISSFQVLIDGDPSFAWTVPTLPNDHVQPDWMCKLIENLSDAEFQRQLLGKRMRDFAKSEGINFMKMMKTLRMLLSGQKDGYQIPEMMHILGRDGTIRRLSRTHDVNLKNLSQSN